MGTCGYRWERTESGPDRLPVAVHRGFLSTLAGSAPCSCCRQWRTCRDHTAWDRTACPARSNKLLLEPGRPFRRVCYLRAAQAYMLISMPTGTSTIFGVFQLIRVSPKQCWHDIRAGIKTRLASNVAQAWKSRCRRHTGASDTGNFPLGQGNFALGQGERTKAADRRMNNVGHRFA